MKIKLNETELKKIITESVKKVIKEYDLSSWSNENDGLFSQTIDKMADYVLENIGADYFENAIDLNECDGDDIERLLSCVDDVETGIFDKPYRIKAIVSKYCGRQYVPVMEQMVEENYQDVLDGDLLDAVYDRYDVQSVTGKNMYGGGGYETIKDLSIAVKNKVADKIKKMYL